MGLATYNLSLCEAAVVTRSGDQVDHLVFPDKILRLGLAKNIGAQNYLVTPPFFQVDHLGFPDKILKLGLAKKYRSSKFLRIKHLCSFALSSCRSLYNLESAL